MQNSLMFSVWIQFFLLAMVIGVAGYNLSKYADVIAARTGVGRNLIGLILLATITSLPELVSGISSVAIAQDANLAAGDIFGSCLFNLSLVFFLDLFHRQSIVFSRVNRAHLLTGALGIILIGYVGFGILVGPRLEHLRIAHVGIFSAVLPILYFLSLRMLYKYERENGIDQNNGLSEQMVDNPISLRRAIIYFVFAAIAVISAGIFLPFVAENIVHTMGWNSAFVGTIFLAFATSLPEMAATYGAFRIGAYDLAFSNLLGSNIFNIIILFIDDVFYLKGPIFQSISPVHAVTAFSAVMMTGLVIVALIQPPQRRVFNLVTGLSFILLAVYLFNTYIVFKMGN